MKKGSNVISPLCSLGETSLLEGRNMMIDILGPYVLLARPNSSSQTREAVRTRKERVKLHVLNSIYMFSHRVACAVLDSMHTSSLTGGLHQIVLEHGWQPSELSFDAGSSRIPAASQAA